MATMQEITCRCGCGRKKMVRTADIKRGWGKFFNKSCKARHQERRTGQYARRVRRWIREDEDMIDWYELHDGDHPLSEGRRLLVRDDAVIYIDKDGNEILMPYDLLELSP